MKKEKITYISNQQKQECKQLLAYLKQKISYLKIDLLRKYRKTTTREYLLKEDDNIEDIAYRCNEDYILNDYERIINNKNLEVAFTTLSPLQKKIIWLNFFKGYSQQEISKLMNTSPSAISQIKNRALKKMKKEIKDL
ncbi:sigma-70 family RNA polymerase sigma factor [Facklamia hominis]|uniref:Sigma-70 family RNA polymerase sigma factor n=2 Tax=Facklamia hominis TaxID=178214 RepID=K1LV03_9LACT|nr:sigma-70 family RNA polymerase sigma factor [Facklamia hominis]EKB53853.1 sigma-70 family RNA polymerase sigma factor [Facklamia hominis CCUG 36813]EPH10684.1 sigma-70 family RNA polymerase sigma factor [Facklamia hominis ACS-120-V-Sch10]MDK7187278.1 sigma-70 family RNA polymerase sigma factor [Facklamia hominis]PKY92289.1 sigma-70 family RNA polymerase sigma factor [Facklamia hominis]WPJ90412.1 sigma-70 family RNA polymerase sigma factor [Facklamia hominis]